MALFGIRRNRGYPEHGRGPLIVDEYSIIDYSASHKSESYMTKSEQVVESRGVPTIIVGHKHSPRRQDLFKDHGLGNNPFLAPWSSARDRPGKADEFSPRYGKGMIHGQRKGSPWDDVPMDNSPRSPDYGKYHYNFDYSDSDDDIIHNDAVYVKNDKERVGRNHLKEEDYANGFAPPHRSQEIIPLRRTRPTDAVGRKWSGGNSGDAQSPRATRYDSYSDNNEKHQENYHITRPHNVPPSTQPKRDTYYEAPYPDNNEKHKGDRYAPPPYNAPITTQPRNDAYYETSNGSPKMTGPPPIKTRSETGRVNENMRNSPLSGQKPQFNASPRQDRAYPEVIDSMEARRRYAKASPRAEARTEENYTRIIDSREAARRYNGVFVNY